MPRTGAQRGSPAHRLTAFRPKVDDNRRLSPPLDTIASAQWAKRLGTTARDAATPERHARTRRVNTEMATATASRRTLRSTRCVSYVGWIRHWLGSRGRPDKDRSALPRCAAPYPVVIFPSGAVASNCLIYSGNLSFCLTFSGNLNGVQSHPEWGFTLELSQHLWDPTRSSDIEHDRHV
jgi:hypothetical protein